MWENTLLLLTSDNGGDCGLPRNPGNPHAPSQPGSASNYPLLGRKCTAFEGGTRVAAFIAGGRVPAARRGTVYGNFGISSDHPRGVSALCTTPHAPCDALYLVPMLIGCAMVHAIRCHDQFTCSGPTSSSTSPTGMIRPSLGCFLLFDPVSSLSLSYPARIVMYHLTWAMSPTLSC